MSQPKTKIVPIVRVECDCCAHMKKHLFECPLENCSYTMCADCCQKTWDGTETSKCPACRRERWPFYDIDTNEAIYCPACLMGFPFKCPRCWDYVHNCWNPGRFIHPTQHCISNGCFYMVQCRNGMLNQLIREQENIEKCLCIGLDYFCKFLFYVVASILAILVGRLVWLILGMGGMEDNYYWADFTYFFATGVAGAIIICCCGTACGCCVVHSGEIDSYE